MLEIERKFLITTIPEEIHLEDFPFFEIAQGYVKEADGKANKYRLRKKGDVYYKTFKSGKGLSREEIETKITKEAFEEGWKLVGDWHLEKTRYNIPYGNYTIELDVFRNMLDGLMFAEVEFPNEEEANAFVPPVWFGEELTYDEEAKNSHMAKYGMSNALKQKMRKE